MFRSKVCLTLTGSTLKENLSYIEKYRRWIDLVELRVDYLDSEEKLYVRKFPELAKIPAILTIRRVIDGGKFEGGESGRTALFARALSFADQDVRKNFAYVDFEEDFRVSCLQDACLAFETRIIRSVHDMTNPIRNIAQYVSKLRLTGFEIPKIAFNPHTLDDVTNLFKEARSLQDVDCILCAMGPLGYPSRILATKLHSFLTYTSPTEANTIGQLGHLDPITLGTIYRFNRIDADTKVFGIAGYPLEQPHVHTIYNTKYDNHDLNAVYIPIQVQNVHKVFDFAKELDISAFSVTYPHKERIIEYADYVSAEAGQIGACSSLIKEGDHWHGYNSDAMALTRALLEFLGETSLRGKKVSIIGAGGRGRAAAYVVKTLGGKACVFNRTQLKAKKLSDFYGLEWAPLDESHALKMQEFSDLFIYTLPHISLHERPELDDDNEDKNDILFFYEFNGHESVFDMNFTEEKTTFSKRAEEEGCLVSNGMTMLKYQSEIQFELFTGIRNT